MSQQTRKVVAYSDHAIAHLVYTVTIDHGDRRAYAFGAGMLQITRNEAAMTIRTFRRRSRRAGANLGKGNTVGVVVFRAPVGSLILATCPDRTVRRVPDARTWMDVESGVPMAAGVRPQAGTRATP